MCGQRCHHEFHILSTNNERTHIVTFEDSFRKPMLICESCASYYNDYKVRQMLGIRCTFQILGVSGSEDRGGGDNSIQFINIGREGDKSFKEWRRKIGGWAGG